MQLREDAVNQALQTIERRVNELGVAEPIVARHSAADQILVQLPGVTDVARAKEIIRSTAQLELKLVEQGPFSRRGAARAGVRQQRAARPADPAGHDERARRAAGRAPAITSSRRVAGGHRPRPAQRASVARREQPPGGELLAQHEGARKFGTFTQANISRQLAIVLDNRVSRRRTSSRASTTKASSAAASPTQEAQDLSLVLRSGALPA